jgi:lipid II:glycine glycyltransferase (peptidoglycan interpeptide bridge formation enzyme)
MDVVVAGIADRARYDAFVASRPDGDALQSWAWGEVKRSSGWAPTRLLVTDGADTLAAASVLRLVPMRGVPPILYAPRGPVWSREDALAPLIATLRQHAQGAYLFTCDPPVTDASPLLRAGLRTVASSGFGGVQPKAVMTLDLTGGADAVFEGFKSKWRYNCRLAERKGVKVRDGDRSDLDAWYRILVETAIRDRFLVRGVGYFETLWEELGSAGMLRLLIAEHEGEQIAGILLFRFGQRITYVYGASANAKRDLMPNHLLQWTAIRDAANDGIATYDFRGVSPIRDGEPSEPHLAGLNRFKEGFGARYVEYAGQLDLPLRSGWYWAWTNLAPSVLAWRRRRAGGAGSAAE